MLDILNNKININIRVIDIFVFMIENNFFKVVEILIFWGNFLINI